MSLLGFGMGTMLANFHMCGIMLGLRAGFQHAREECDSKMPMCFKYLMFSFVSCYFYFVLLPLGPELWRG